MRCPSCQRRLLPTVACPVHAAAPLVVHAAPAADAPPVDGLVLGELLGGGGFGLVFAAREQGSGRELALKLGNGDGGASWRAGREAAALRRLGPPVTPALLGEGRLADGRPYLLMERLYGETLAETMAALPGDGAAPRALVCTLALALAGLLERVHALGLVHRDLKPENVFVLAGASGVRLLDFGLACRAGEAAEPEPGPSSDELSATRTGAVLGTATYMAPEQCAGARHVDARADVYALGVLLHELLAGRPPFAGSDAEQRAAHLARRPPSLGLGTVDDVLARFLAKRPEARWPDARAGAFALVAALGTSVPALVPGVPGMPAVPGVPGASALGPSGRAAAASASAPRLVAMLGVRSSLPLPELAELAAADGGGVARVRDDGYLLLFRHPSPVQAAKAAARVAARVHAVDRGGRQVVHVAELRVREAARGVVASGAALDAPAWWPAPPGVGTQLTREAGELLGSEATDLAAAAPTLAEGTLAPAVPPPLLGREALLAAVLAQAAAVFAARTPALTTLLGDTGSGKTRLLAAIADALPANVRRFDLPQALARADERAAAAAAGASRRDRAHALAGELTAAAAAGPLLMLVDDAHRGEAILLDAVELATMSHDLPLFVVAAAHPSLLEHRPLWGERAQAGQRHVLGPLDERAARALMTALLAPLDVVPEQALERLLAAAQGVPLVMVELADALRAAGAIRRHTGMDGHYLAVDDLLEVSATPLGRRLAERALAVLSPQLAAFAQLCAVAGEELDQAELAAAQAELPAGVPAASLDAGVGLDRLARAGLLARVAGGGHRFRSPLVREAVEAAAAAPARAQAHRALLGLLARLADPPLERIARHAAACGERERACAAYQARAEALRARHQYVEADACYSAALRELAPDTSAVRARLLAGRGSVRYRAQRLHEAGEDLRAALALAEEVGDRVLAVELLLELATVDDWCDRWQASAEHVARAGKLLTGGPDAGLACRLATARARTRYREQRPDAVDALAAAALEAARAGEHEAHVIALMLLGPALVVLGELERAETVFAEIIRACEATGDTLHLCSAYNVRGWMWIKREAFERALDDRRRATALARELGNAAMERSCAYNQAEMLLWCGDTGAALPLARRAQDLQRRFIGATAVDGLLVARILIARGEHATAAAELAAARGQDEGELQPMMRMHFDLVATASSAAAPSAAWDALVAAATEVNSIHELFEVLHVAIVAALAHADLDQAERRLVSARAAAVGSPMWRERFARLQDKLTGLRS